MVLPADLLSVVLSKLTIDLLYRLIFVNSGVRKTISEQSFWRKLIERDLGVVPKFPNDLKLYYLRANGLRIRGTLWKRKTEKPKNNQAYYQPDQFSKTSTNKVLHLTDYGGYIGSNERFYWWDHAFSPPKGDRFRELVVWNGEKLLLTYRGRLIDLDNRMVDPIGIANIVQITARDLFHYIGQDLIRTGDGSVYTYDKIRLPLPHPIVHIDRLGGMLDIYGTLYHYRPITQFLVLGWAPHGSIPVSDIGHLIVDDLHLHWSFGWDKVKADETIEGVISTPPILGEYRIGRAVGYSGFIDDDLSILNYENYLDCDRSLQNASKFVQTTEFGKGVLQLDQFQIRVLDR